MADQPQAEQANPFDSDFGKPTIAVAPPPETPAVAPVDDRPRNPDGTFKKIHQHESYVVQAARSFGYTDDEIAETAPTQLHREVTKIYQNRESMRQIAATQKTMDASTQRTQEAVAAIPPEDDFEIPADELEGLAITNPGLAKLFKKLPKALKDTIKENADLKSRLEAREKHDVERENRTTFAMVDDAFESLGEKGAEWFGKGDMASLVDPATQKPLGQEAMRRNIVYASAGILAGDTAKTIERKIASAAKLFVRESVAAPAKPAEVNPYTDPTNGETNGTAKEPPERSIVVNGKAYSKDEWEQAFGEGGVARPTHRNVDDLPLGEERAIEGIRAKQRVESGSQQSRISQLGLLKG